MRFMGSLRPLPFGTKKILPTSAITFLPPLHFYHLEQATAIDFVSFLLPLVGMYPSSLVVLGLHLHASFSDRLSSAACHLKPPLVT
jgi:hypothetical protein